MSSAAATTSSTTSFKDLPDELVLKVLSHLHHWTLARRVSLVSKRFARLAKDPALFVSLQLIIDNYKTNKAGLAASKLLDRCSKLRRLDVRTEDIIFNRFICSAATIAAEEPPPEWKSHLDEALLAIKALKLWPKLRWLTMTYANMFVLETIMLFAFSLTKLELKVSNSSKCDDWVVPSAAAGLQHLTELHVTAVDESSQKITAGFVAYCSSSSKQLKSVTLLECDDQVPNSLLLSSKDTLEKLCIKSTTFEYLREVTSLPRLKHLEISSMWLAPMDFPYSTNLRCLKIRGKYNDAMMIKLADNCPNLHLLDLRWGSITDTGLGYILASCTKLEELSLYCVGSNISSEAFKIGNPQSLKRLDSYDTLSSRSRDEIVNMLLPELKFVEIRNLDKYRRPLLTHEEMASWKYFENQ